MADPKIISLGSLYFDNVPVSPGQKSCGERIDIGNTVPGKEIPFVQWGNLYVADRYICTNISWEDLNKHGFIFGQAVWIDGNPYLCRSLKVGVKEGDPNEWDALLDTFGENDGLWHWENQFFWGQETSSEWPLFRAVRGDDSARSRDCYPATYRSTDVGFCSVLEPLPPMPPITDAVIGHYIKIYGVDGPVAGRLAGYNDYDLELKAEEHLPDGWTWIRKTTDSVFVDRDSIIYIQG